jgi:hypothetical protein
MKILNGIQNLSHFNKIKHNFIYLFSVEIEKEEINKLIELYNSHAYAKVIEDTVNIDILLYTNKELGLNSPERICILYPNNRFIYLNNGSEHINPELISKIKRLMLLL